MGGQTRINPWERRFGLAVVGLLLLGLVAAAVIRIARMRRTVSTPADAPVELAGAEMAIAATGPAPVAAAAVLQARARGADPLEASPAGERPGWTQGAGDGGGRIEEKQDNFMPKAIDVDRDEQPLTALDRAAMPAGHARVERAPTDPTQHAGRHGGRTEPRVARQDGGLSEDATSATKALSPEVATGRVPRASEGHLEGSTTPRHPTQPTGARSGNVGSRYATLPPDGAPAPGVPRRTGETSPAPISDDRQDEPAERPVDRAAMPHAGPTADRSDRLPPRTGHGGSAPGDRGAVARRSVAAAAALRWTEQPASVGTAGPDYRVQPGDSMWTIARDVYGSSAFFRALTAYNHRRYPDTQRLRVGDVVQTPRIDRLRSLYPNLCPVPHDRAAAETGDPTDAAAGRWYVVEEGDTLYEIARFELGQAARWTEIVTLNRKTLGDEYSNLRPGTRLLLPERATPNPIAARPNREGQRY